MATSSTSVRTPGETPATTPRASNCPRSAWRGLERARPRPSRSAGILSVRPRQFNAGPTGEMCCLPERRQHSERVGPTGTASLASTTSSWCCSKCAGRWHGCWSGFHCTRRETPAVLAASPIHRPCRPLADTRRRIEAAAPACVDHAQGAAASPSTDMAKTWPPKNVARRSAGCQRWVLLPGSAEDHRAKLGRSSAGCESAAPALCKALRLPATS